MKMTMMTEYDSDVIDSGEEDYLNNVILAFINSNEEDANEKPNATRSGRAMTRRSKIDFSFFCVFCLLPCLHGERNNMK